LLNFQSNVLSFLNSTAFILLGSPATWAELLGAVLGIVMVVCNIRQIHWGWPLAFLSSALYFLVFWGSKLYGDASLQIFFAMTALWGWVQWLRGVRLSCEAVRVQRLGHANTIKIIAACIVLFGATGLFLKNFTNTDVPWWDAFPTALSLVATVLLARKYIENWLLWIAVNLVSIALFAYKGLWLTVVLYAVFAAMAVAGWLAWRRQLAASASAA
jgi:nicotinamide mononucleotide transporter